MYAEDIRGKIEIKNYDTLLPYPTRPRKPHLGPNVTSGRARVYAEELEQYGREEAAFKSQYREYREDAQAKVNQFMKDVVAMFVAAGATEKQGLKAYNIAWDRCHSEGLAGVLNYAETLCEIWED
jgi:hypothetical protein